MLWIVSQSKVLYACSTRPTQSDVIKRHPVISPVHYYGFSISKEKQATACHWLSMRAVYNELNTREKTTTTVWVELLIICLLFCVFSWNTVVLLNLCSKAKKAYFQQKSKITLGRFSGNHIPLTINGPVYWTFFCLYFCFYNEYIMSTQLEIESELFWLGDYWDQWLLLVLDYTQIRGAEESHFVIHIFRSSPLYFFEKKQPSFQEFSTLCTQLFNYPD